MTIANSLSRLMPTGLANRLRPRWHWMVEKRALRKLGARFHRDDELGGWVVRLPVAGHGEMWLVARTFREFRRIAQFGRHPDNAVWKWLNWIDDGKVVYDVGSANGLEGCYAGHVHGGVVCFIEPYTPSIETILKSTYLAGQHGGRCQFEIVHAGCSSEEGYQRLQMHGAPLAGQTRNTYGGREDYEEGGGRDRGNMVISQWIKGVTLDCLSQVYDLAPPDYVKIDVDGHETKVMQGAAKLLEQGTVRSWAIELSGDDRIRDITALMEGHGYVVAEEFEHYPGLVPPTVDRIFVRPEDLPSWQSYSVAAMG